MKTIAVLTSGGDSPGMNACLRAVAKVAAARGVHVLGALEGYEGLIDGHFRELTRPLASGGVATDPELDVVGGMGGTLIGSARSSRFREAGYRKQAYDSLKARQVDGLIVIGGNGSLTGAHAFANEQHFNTVGIPGSIDNDIGCTSTCLGVDTALNTIVDACDKISDTARAHRRAFVVEVMGRDCGYLAMASSVALAADAALLREQGKTEEQLVAAVADVVRRGITRGKRRVLVIKAEGVQMPTTKLVRQVETSLAPELPGLEIRATVLGHVVRGGNPSYQDRAVAGRLAAVAVASMLEGATDEMVAWQTRNKGGIATLDPFVHRFKLDEVLRETTALIDGSSPIVQGRLKLMQVAADVLPL
jgi:6-phosphofructokinase 1